MTVFKRFPHPRKSPVAAIRKIAAFLACAYAGDSSAKPAQRLVTTTSTPSSGGYVSGAGSFLDGVDATLTATPATGYTFAGWSGDASGTTNPLVLNVDKDYAITATFSFASSGGFAVAAVPNPVGSGYVSGAGSLTSGDTVTLTATAASGFEFSGWGGDASGTDNPLTLTVTQALDITADFSLTSGKGYAVAVAASPTGAGHVSGGGAYQEGGDAVLTATPGDGYKFTGWSGDAAGTENPLTVLVDKVLNITADFAYDAPSRYAVSVDVDPTGHGWAHGGGSFIEGEEATLTATPGPRYVFTGWSGDVDGTDNPLTVTVDKALSITANFNYDVGDRFVRVGEGKFNMGNPAKTKGAEGPAHEVHLDSYFIDKYEITRGIWKQVMNWGESNGYAFDYTGKATGSNSQIPAAKTDDHPVIVTWYDAVKWCNARSEMENRPPVYYTDTQKTQVYRSGVVDLTDSMVNWSALGYRLPTEAEWEKAARGGLAGKSYPNGDTLDDTLAYFDHDLGDTVKAGQYPANGYGIYDMAGNVWEACWDWYGKNYYSDGAASNDNPRGPATGNYRVVRGGAGDSTSNRSRVNFRLDFNKTWTQYAIGFRCAIPEPPLEPYKTLQVVANPDTHGTVEGSGRYQPDATATIKVKAATGAKFTGWGGDATGAETTLSVTLDVDKTVTAAFEDDPSHPFTAVVLAASPASYGAVTGGGTYAPGSEVILTAVPVAGAKFKGWNGDASGTINPLTITLDADKTVTAEFEPDTSTLSHALSLASSPASHGKVTGGGTYAPGTEVTVTATPVTGVIFTGWSGSATGTENPLTVTMDAAKSITANFAQDPASTAYALTIATDPAGLGTVVGGGSYKAGTTATLVATPASGSTFIGWKGDATGTENPLSVTMDAAKSITAEFEKELEDEVTFQIDEGETDIATLSAPKSAATPKWEATGGDDATLFVLDSSTGKLIFNFTPDFESPQDADRDNSYELTIQVKDDATGEIKGSQDIHVEIQDVAEAPSITSNGGGDTADASVDENSTDAVATVTATDPDGDTVSLSLTGGADQALFNIDGTSGALSFKAAPDFEAPADADKDNEYVVEVTATDDSSDTLTDKQTLTVTVADVNEAPTFTTVSMTVEEGNTAVATILAADPDDDGLEYTLTGGADKDLFTLDKATGALAFTAAPDFEAPADADKDNTYDIEVTLTDDGAGTLSTAKTFGVAITDKPEAPSITSNGGGDTASVDVAENTTDVTTVTATDPDGDGLAYSLTGGADKDLFDLNAGFGVLTFKAAPDFEAPADADGDNNYEVEVTVTDDGTGNQTDAQALTVTVSDANEPPVITSNDGGATADVSLSEGEQSVTTVVATDPDNDTLAYSISGGADAALFSIDAAGALTFKVAPDFADPKDADKDNAYLVEVTATDDGDGNLTDSQTLTVTVGNVLEVPIITSDGGGDSAALAVDENITTAVTTVTATDPDGSGVDFKISGGDDASLFSIDNDSGELTFITPPDNELPSDNGGDNVYEVEVSAIGKVKADLIDADFDADAAGFTYQDDPLGTNRPDLANGTYLATGGFVGGALRSVTGPGSGGSNSGNLSAGWTRDITLTESTDLEISLRYRMTMSEGFESDEWGAAWLQIAGTMYGNDTGNYLVRMTGNGNGGGTGDSGWKQDTFNLNLPAGTHTIAFGAYNNKATAADEITTVWVDDLSIRYAASDRQTLTITVRNLDEAPTDIVFPSAPIPEGQPIGRKVGTLIAIDGDGLSGFDPMDGLEAWYDFENVTGNAVPDRNSKYPGTLYYGAAVSPFGKYGKGIAIPTTGPRNDEARLQVNNVLGIDVDETWTGTAWFKKLYPQNGSWRTLFRGAGGNHVGIVDRNSHTLGFWDSVTGRNWIPTSFTMDPADYQEWHHFTVVADRTKTDYYIDGAHVGWVNQVSQTDVSMIGNYTSSQRFAEFLDDVRIYNRAFDSGEVQQLYLSGEQTTSLETHTFALVAGDGDDDNAAFTLEDGQLRANAIYNYDDKNTYKIRVKVTDKDGLTYEKAGVLKIKAMPPVLEAYTEENVVYGRGFPAQENKPTVTGGKATQFSVSPTLPSGLSIDDETGIISGTPSSVYGSRDHTITVSGPGGSTNLTIRIGVEERVPEFQDPPYAGANPLVLAEGMRMVNAYPFMYGYSRDYNVTPALPQGITLYDTYGYIYGTPRNPNVLARAFWSFNEGNFRETSNAQQDNDVYPAGNPGHSADTADGEHLAADLDGDGDALHMQTPFHFKSTDPWAVSFWAIRPGNTFQGMVMGNRNNDNDYVWLSNSPAYGFSFRNSQGQNASWTDADLRNGFSQWHHYLLTADGQGSIDLYRDGAHQGTKTADTSFVINTLGNAFSSQNLALKGRLDDVAIFNIAMTEMHARSLYYNGKPIDISQGLALEPLIYNGTVSATNSKGTAQAPLQIKIVPRSQVVKFETDQGGFPYGEAPETTLSWEILHADKAYLLGKEVPTRGTMKVTPSATEATSYLLYGAVGQGEFSDADIVNFGPFYSVGPFNTSNPFNTAVGPEGKPINLDDTFTQGATPLKWERQDGWIDGVNNSLISAANNITYIYRTLTVTSARKLKMNLRTDDGVRIWLNGIEVYANGNAGTHTPTLDLPAGDSEMLIKIFDTGTVHSFTFDSNAMPGYLTTARLTLAPHNLAKADIGNSTSLGTIDFESGTGTYTMTGRGTGIIYGSDRFLFGSSKMIGDGEVTVRVATFSGPSNNAVAGLHMRGNWGSNQPSVAMVLRNNDTAEYRVRPNWRRGSSHIHSEANIKAPYFLRLVRVGDDFSGYVSQDGSDWLEVARWTSIIEPTLEVGLALMSGSSTEDATATFDSFQIKRYDAHGLKGLWRFNNVSNNTAADRSVYGQDAELTDITAVDDLQRGPVLSFNGGGVLYPRSGIT